MKIKILIPIYNDWQSVFKLLENINSEVSGLDHEFSIIIVNDASTEARPKISLNLDNLKSIKIINMKENRGHARCNAAGLKYIHEKEDFDYVIPMDGDGEVRPEEIKQFIENINYYPDKVIVGERIKRSEGLIFKICYFIHKIITIVFTGKSIKFGNYTFLPKSTVQKMVDEKSTWSSFSGSLAKLEKDRAVVPSIRGTRYFGPSKMNFINLVKHSLSIIAVFKITFLIRSFIFLFVYLFLVSQHVSIITLIPIALVIIMVFSVFTLSKRENITEYLSSTKNISDIIQIK